MHPKYVAAKEALKLARSHDVFDGWYLEVEIDNIKGASEILCSAIEDYIRSKHQMTEPFRKSNNIKKALGYARGNKSTDYFYMMECMQRAEKHSQRPLRQRVYDSVFTEYNKHEGHRLKRAISSGNMYAGGTISYGSDWESLQQTIETAWHHTNGLKTTAACYFAEQALKVKYVFCHLPMIRKS